MNTILITGGTGTMGQLLTERLLAMGYNVRFLSTRNSYQQKGVEVFHWDPSQYKMESDALIGTDAIIHLAGATLSKRWTQSYKEEIYNSRIQSTDTLYRYLVETDHSVKHLISASAVGYYPSDPSRLYVETDAPGTGFLSAICHHWEEHVQMIGSLGIREARLRVGIFLDEGSGALPKMAMPIRYGLGAPLGSGQQYVPWVHRSDVIRMFLHLLFHPELSGPFNGVGPTNVTNRELTRSIARVLNRPLILPPIPGFILKIALGQMASTALYSTKVSNQKILESGFEYEFYDLEKALEDLLK